MDLPDNQVSDFIVPNSVPDADPSDTILFLAQLDKSLNEIKDKNLARLASQEVKFFKMAAAIIASQDNDPAYAAIRVRFGSGIDAVKKLAASLRQVALKKQADGIINKVSETKVAESYDNAGLAVGEKSVKDRLADASGNPFKF